MPLPYEVRKISDLEYRLRILLCVDALGMVTREQLWPFVARQELMDYVPMCLYIDELISDGALTRGAYATAGDLFLTDEGRAALKLFRNVLPQSDRARIAAAAPGYAAGVRDRRQARAGYELAAEGRYRCLCSLAETGEPLLLFRVDAEDPALVNRVTRLFRSRVTRLLTCLYGLAPVAEAAAILPAAGSLLEALELATPESPALCALGGRAHAAAAALPLGSTMFRVALALPTKEAALGWASSALKQREAVAIQLQRIFEAGEKQE